MVNKCLARLACNKCVANMTICEAKLAHLKARIKEAVAWRIIVADQRVVAYYRPGINPA